MHKDGPFIVIKYFLTARTVDVHASLGETECDWEGVSATPEFSDQPRPFVKKLKHSSMSNACNSSGSILRCE